MPAGAAPDSLNLLPAFLGDDPKGRDDLVLQAGPLSLTDGSWKYIAPSKGPKKSPHTHIEMGNDPVGQLYDLRSDPGETRNLSAEHPDRVAAFAAKLQKLREAGSR